VHALPGLEVDLVLKVEQSVQLRVHFQDDVAAVAAPPAIRAAAWYVFLAPKADRSVAAVAGLDVNPRFVKKHAQALRRWR